MLQSLLARRFNLAMHVDPKKLSGYALVLAKGGSKLRGPTGTRAQVTRTGTHMEAHHLGLSSLLDTLQVILGRPVVDRTGLQGAFDFTLDWTRDTTPTAPADAAPSIFTAVQEPLGLKLEPLAAAGDLYVIDRVGRPRPSRSRRSIACLSAQPSSIFSITPTSGSRGLTLPPARSAKS